MAAVLNTKITLGPLLKGFILLSTLFYFEFTLAGESMDLSKYKWENRILLICDTKESSYKNIEQKKIFESKPNEAAERDLLLLNVKPKVFNKFDKSECLDFKMLLIGKDGGVKETYSSPTLMNKVFALIDTMPMRKKEMNPSSK